MLCHIICIINFQNFSTYFTYDYKKSQINHERTQLKKYLKTIHTIFWCYPMNLCYMSFDINVEWVTCSAWAALVVCHMCCVRIVQYFWIVSRKHLDIPFKYCFNFWINICEENEMTCEKFYFKVIKRFSKYNVLKNAFIFLSNFHFHLIWIFGKSFRIKCFK
jgi:hypothetical protein